MSDWNFGERLTIGTSENYIWLRLDDVGVVAVSTWLPFRRWRINRAKQKLLELQQDLEWTKT